MIPNQTASDSLHPPVIAGVSRVGRVGGFLRPMKTYAEKLKDPRWQKMRLQILERDGFVCRRCQSKEKTLHVHHAFYSKGKAPWEYDPKFLQTLCEECHELAEKERMTVLMAMSEPSTSRKFANLASVNWTSESPFQELMFLDWALDDIARLASMWMAREFGEISDEGGEVTDEINQSIESAVRNLYRFALEPEFIERKTPTA